MSAVAHFSLLEYDRGEKAELYAEAGIIDYWIANVRDQCVEVFREPTGRAFGRVDVYRGDDEVRSPVLPEMVLRPSMLRGPRAMGPLCR